MFLMAFGGLGVYVGGGGGGCGVFDDDFAELVLMILMLMILMLMMLMLMIIMLIPSPPHVSPPPPFHSYGGLGDFFLLLQNATASLPQSATRKYIVVGGDEMARLARLARNM